MADQNNPGQFGSDNRDTQMEASKGDQMSSGKFGSPQGADPHKAGKKGAANQPTDAKRRGGEIGGSRSRRS